MMRLKLFLFLITLLLTECSHSMLDSKKTYRKTLSFEVDGEEAEGVYSAKKKSSYHIEIEIPQKPTLVKITSCHQERIFAKPGKDIEFDYRPNADIEAGDLPCPIEISALETSGKNQWGLIDFKLPSEVLPAKISCNGDTAKAVGSFICQSRSGLIQSVEFEKPVSSYSPKGCNKIEQDQGKKFYLNVTEGNCFYLFADSSENLFRLVTFGYTEALLDGNNRFNHDNPRGGDHYLLVSK